MKRFFSNANNKHELIKLLSDVFTSNGIEVHVATDDADTMIVSKALKLSLQSEVEIKAEDTDILCLLIHHYSPTHNNDIVMTTRSDSHSIGNIVNALDPTQKELLLFIHSFSGCGTVSSIYGFGKEAILKKSCSIL